MTRMCVQLGTIGAMLVLTAGTAAAQTGMYQGYATAFLGAALGGDLNESSRALGAAASVVNRDSGWGAEMDFGFSDDDSGIVEADLTTFMLNVAWTRVDGWLRPFASGGVGALRLHGCVSGCPTVASTTDFGANAGAGAFVRVNEAFALRGDVRYLWAPGEHPDLSRPDNFGFWRATFGVTVMWNVAP